MPSDTCGFRVAENNRPICLIQAYKTCSRDALFSGGDWILRRRSSASGSDLGRSTSVAEPHRLRFSLSHFLGRRTSLKLSGRRTATRSCGDALYVSWSRSPDTDAAASRDCCVDCKSCEIAETEGPVCGTRERAHLPLSPLVAE
jgi:hypothetical protein